MPDISSTERAAQIHLRETGHRLAWTFDGSWFCSDCDVSPVREEARRG